MKKEKYYNRYDTLDEKDSHRETFSEMKEWLKDFWRVNPDEDWDFEGVDCEKFFREIDNADESELLDIMMGVAYAFEECEEM